MKKYCVLLVGLLLASTLRAQLSGTNILEAQVGNIPDQEPDNMKTMYDQFNIQYKFRGFKASVRLEQFYTSNKEGDEYFNLSQYSLNYRTRGFEAKLGNFNETLGRGLLLRSYEIKNSIIEDRISRVKHGFYQDIRGAFARYSNNWMEVKALHGKSLVSQLPPDHPDNRIDQVSAGQLSFFVAEQRPGLIFLKNDNPEQESRYLGFFAGGRLSGAIDYYGEVAHQLGDGFTYLNFGDNDSYGAYLNLNFSHKKLGVSLEWKDYHNFVIGSGLGDPPTLIKEHSYKTLNRSTHVGELLDETGFQAEIFYSLNEKNRFTFNHSRGFNDFGARYQFQEYFAEWYADFVTTQLKTFLDWAKDEFKQDKSRIAGGVYLTQSISPKSVISLETEAQQIEKGFGEDPKVENFYVGFIYQYHSRFSAALLWEYTSDVVVADLPSTQEVETTRSYWGGALSYRPNGKNSIQLFAGQRRGGPACTSGVCYEVLDFEGIEIRWTKRF